MENKQSLNNAETAPKAPLFDIEDERFYAYKEPKERTRKRLIEIAQCGMEEIGIASFGFKGVMGGLYIEFVWNYSDEDFKKYMDWARGVISTSLNNTKKTQNNG